MADQYIQQGNEAVASQTGDTGSPANNSFGFMDGSSFNASGSQIAPPTNRNIPVGQVGSTKAIDLPQPESIDLSSGVVESAKTGSKSITDYLKELSAPETAAGQTQSKLLADLQSLIPQTGGKAQAQLDAEQAQGIPTLKADLASLNSQILSKVAEFDKISNEIEKNSNFKGSFSAKANELKRTYAAETGLLQARALGLQGQVQAAQETVNRAIDLKYSAIEEKLNIYEAQLRALEPILNKEEKDLATARQLKIDDDKQRVAEEKAKAKENAGLAFSADIRTEFVNKNGEFFNARTGETYNDPAAFFKAAGVSSFEDAYKRGLITDLTASKLSDIDFANQARTKYIDANIKMTDTPEQVAAKVRGSSIWRKETYIAPTGGSGPGTLAGSPIVDASTDAAVKQLIASKPGDGQYGAAYEAVKAQFGEAVAKKYDRVYQTVFNEGGTVDAGFNNAKLGSAASGNPAVDSALSVILGSDKFTKDQKASITQAVQTGQDPFSVIKNQAKNIMGQTNATTLDKYESAKQQLAAIQSSLQQYYDNGGKTNVFSGNYEKAINKLGEVKDAKLVNIATQIQSALQVYRNAVSGTAYSVQEGSDIAAIFPGINKSQGLNDAIISGRLKAFDDSIDGAYRNTLGGAYDQLKGGANMFDEAAYQEYLKIVGK